MGWRKEKAQPEASDRHNESAEEPVDWSWGLLPAALLSVALILRTVGEDRALHRELSGYEEYAQKTRYRRLPGTG